MCWLQAIDFTKQVRKAIKSSNLLRTKWTQELMSVGLTCLCFRCTRKRFLLNEILIMFPLHMINKACRWLHKNAGEMGKICGNNTYHGKKLEQIILWNIATPLEAKPTIKGELLVS